MEWIDNLIKAANWIFDSIDWIYVLSFIMLAWFVSRMFGDFTFLRRLSTKIKTKWWVALSAILWSVIFNIIYYFEGPFPWNENIRTPYIITTILSTLMAMFLNEYIGFDKILDRIFKIQNNE